MSTPKERVIIRGGRVIDPANAVDDTLNVCLAGGRVVSVGHCPDGFQADLELDATGLVVCPGLIDLAARPGEPGLEHKATIASETRAAAAAGITTLCCMPDTRPTLDTAAVVNLVKERASLAGKVKVLPIGALTRGLNGKDLSDMSALKQAGCLAVSNACAAVINPLVLRRALEYAASYDLLVILRPEDPHLANQGCVHEGAIATRLGLPGIPHAAETVAVAQVLALIEDTGVRVHFSQISSGRAVQMIRVARTQGIRVTADVAAHQLQWTDACVEDFDPLYHLRPPLRTEADRLALCQGVQEGVIAAICSAHQPHEPDAKRDTFPATEPGIAALETLLPLTLDQVTRGSLDIMTALAALTSQPARILGLESGHLSPGAPADLCLFDPAATWTVDAETWHSQGRNTPYWGCCLQGRVRYTLIDGCLVGNWTGIHTQR